MPIAAPRPRSASSRACIAGRVTSFSASTEGAKPAYTAFTAQEAAEDATSGHCRKALTFRADGTVYCIKTKGAGVALRGAKVELRHRLDGTMTVHDKDRILPVSAARTSPVPDPAEDEKTIDLRLNNIVAAQRTAVLARLEAGRG